VSTRETIGGARRRTSRPPRPAQRAPARRAHLGAAARDERSHRVGAEPEPLAHAGGEGDHILDRAANLDADHVLCVVAAEHVRVEDLAKLAREAGRIARDHHGGRELARDLLGEGGAGEEGHGVLGAEHVAEQVAHQRERALLDPLGKREDRHVGPEVRLDLGERRARKLDRHRVAHVGSALEGLGGRRGGANLGREFKLGQPQRISPLLVDVVADVLFAHEDVDPVAFSREEQRHRGAKAAAAEDDEFGGPKCAPVRHRGQRGRPHCPAQRARRKQEPDRDLGECPHHAQAWANWM
jgi:hypothetical protein